MSSDFGELENKKYRLKSDVNIYYIYCMWFNI